jgi:Uma2 family endonuclease
VSIHARLGLLPFRVKLVTPLGDDALYDFCQENPDLRIERTREGELIIMSPTGSETGRRNFNIIGQLYAWVERDGRGVGFDSSTGFILRNGAERSPDAAWVRRERWEALTVEQRRKFAPLCPDFLIELRSQTDDLSELHAKLAEYVECGAALAWLIDAEQRKFWVYGPGAPPQLLESPDRVSGDPELPGFELDCSRIW